MIKTEKDVTPAVLAIMEQTPDPRLREIMVSLVTHLHGFIRDVRLTEKEFQSATAIINQIGKLSTDHHNEAVLMSGSLGVSTLICLLNNGNMGEEVTSQNLLGPFWRMHSPVTASGQSIVRSELPGDPLFVSARVIDKAGNPIENAEVDIWHTSPEGLYENQDPKQADMNLRGKFFTDENGCFSFYSLKMPGYPIPTDGVVGRLLTLQNRHPYRPAHLHALIFKPGFKTLISQVYDSTDPNINTDAQFGVTEATIGHYIRHDQPNPHKELKMPWYSLDYTYVMEPGDATLPRAPIK